MVRIGSKGLCVAASVLMPAVFLAGGCNAQHKKLKQDYAALANQKMALQKQLGQAEASNGRLQSRLKASQGQLAQAQARVRELQKKRPTKAKAVSGKTEVVVHTETIATDILFPAGRANLTVGGKRRLSSVARMLKSKHPGRVVRVYGHTDSDPIRRTRRLWKDNLDLSANRAMAVTRFLVGRGIEARRIETVGMGKTRPVADNGTKKGKSRNRRVEIVVVRK